MVYIFVSEGWQSVEWGIYDYHCEYCVCQSSIFGGDSITNTDKARKFTVDILSGYKNRSFSVSLVQTMDELYIISNIKSISTLWKDFNVLILVLCEWKIIVATLCPMQQLCVAVSSYLDICFCLCKNEQTEIGVVLYLQKKGAVSMLFINCEKVHKGITVQQK